MHPLDVAALNTPAALDHFWSLPEQQPGGAYWHGRLDLYHVVAEYLGHFVHEGQPTRVLDVGCGPGHLLAELVRMYPDYPVSLTGVDYALSAVEQAQRLVPRASFVVADILSGAWAPCGVYDVVTACEVLEHQTDPAAFLECLLRLVRPGGHVALTVPNGVNDRCKAHVQRWSSGELAAFLEPFGLRDVHHIRNGTNILAHIQRER